MTTFTEGVQFITHSCGECGIVFAFTQEFYDARRKDHHAWYCPNGHGRTFTGPTEADKLRGELARQREITDAERERAGRLERERDRTAKAHNRMRTRIMNGVCPCCNRTFQNLMRHMQTEHQGELNLRVIREAFGMTQADVASEIGLSAPYISNYERGRPVPAHASARIAAWMDSQAPKRDEALKEIG